MRDALIGHTGFVGGNLCAQHDFAAVYNSRNIAEIEGEAFDALVFAGAQAKKWWANEHPEQDRDRIENALSHLRRVRAGRVIVISTIDVLPARSGLDETFEVAAEQGSAYGANRLYLERALAEMFGAVNVVRLPALFGAGLKKNVIYDLLNDNLLDKINPDSAFQYYDLSRLWSDIGTIVDAGIALIHLFPEPVATGVILERFFPDKEVGGDPAPKALYDYRTRYDYLFGRSDGYIFGAEEVLARLGSFIESARSDRQ